MSREEEYVFTSDEVSVNVRRCVAGEFLMREHLITEGASFGELGGDIGNLRSIALDCNNRFDIEITEEDLKTITSVLDLILCVKRLLITERRLID